MTSERTLEKLQKAKLLGFEAINYNPRGCDNICDDFCDDCPDDRAPTTIRAYNPEIESHYKN